MLQGSAPGPGHVTESIRLQGSAPRLSPERPGPGHPPAALGPGPGNIYHVLVTLGLFAGAAACHVRPAADSESDSVIES